MYIRQAIGRESYHATLANRAATPLQTLCLRLFRHLPWQSWATSLPLYGSCINVACFSFKEESVYPRNL
jgi:hypothetical protein